MVRPLMLPCRGDRPRGAGPGAPRAPDPDRQSSRRRLHRRGISLGHAVGGRRSTVDPTAAGRASRTVEADRAAAARAGRRARRRGDPGRVLRSAAHAGARPLPQLAGRQPRAGRGRPLGDRVAARVLHGQLAGLRRRARARKQRDSVAAQADGAQPRHAPRRRARRQRAHDGVRPLLREGRRRERALR